jgi:hypothetical protein
MYKTIQLNLPFLVLMGLPSQAKEEFFYRYDFYPAKSLA